jgi:hypothetical protein
MPNQRTNPWTLHVQSTLSSFFHYRNTKTDVDPGQEWLHGTQKSLTSRTKLVSLYCEGPDTSLALIPFLWHLHAHPITSRPACFDHSLYPQNEKRAAHVMQSVTSLLIHGFMNLALCSDPQTSAHVRDTKYIWVRLTVRMLYLSSPAAVVGKPSLMGKRRSKWVTYSHLSTTEVKEE